MIHEFVKPASDANTLNIPVPLLEFLRQILRSLPGFARSDIVILLSSDLNYLQYRHGHLKRLISDLRAVITDAPPLPDGLGFIAIPYSQSSRLFTNLLVFHELGHFVFEELSFEQELAEKADRSLRRVIGPGFDAAQPEIKLHCRAQLIRWGEEIFCDLFALRLIGPAYSFASIELFNLLALFGEPSDLEFNESHPSLACRFSEHLRQMDEQGWWAAVNDLESNHTRMIRALAAVPERRYTFNVTENVDLGPWLLSAFRAIRRQVRGLVRRTLAASDTGRASFVKFNRAVQEALSHGIVPSALPMRGRIFHPPPVAVINATFCFYLQSVDRLIRNTAQFQVGNVGHRSLLVSRLEMWATKAIEDYKLLTGQLRE